VLGEIFRAKIVLGKALAKRVKDSKAPMVVINGIRFQDEIENARLLGAKIIYITAPEEIRYQRFLQRKEKADDGGHDLQTFKTQEMEPTEIGIPNLGAQADVKIENLGALENLYQQIDEALNS
jgi:dephospho-CoA kinase